jgi:hypothetical protein
MASGRRALRCKRTRSLIGVGRLTGSGEREAEFYSRWRCGRGSDIAGGMHTVGDGVLWRLKHLDKDGGLLWCWLGRW